jgi:hypothetical protein
VAAAAAREPSTGCNSDNRAGVSSAGPRHLQCKARVEWSSPGCQRSEQRAASRQRRRLRQIRSHKDCVKRTTAWVQNSICYGGALTAAGEVLLGNHQIGAHSATLTCTPQ